MAATEPPAPPQGPPMIAVPMIMGPTLQSISWEEETRTDGVKIVKILSQTSHATVLIEVDMDSARRLRDGLTHILTGGLEVVREIPANGKAPGPLGPFRP